MLVNFVTDPKHQAGRPHHTIAVQTQMPCGDRKRTLLLGKKQVCQDFALGQWLLIIAVLFVLVSGRAKAVLETECLV